MLLWQTPIVDRTQADIDEVNVLKGIAWDDMTEAQKTAWSKGLKGALNESDLERIENNIHLLSEVLELGLVTYDRNIPYIPNLSYWSNLILNVSTIRTSYSVHSDTPQVPDTPINVFNKVNDIEKILLDIYEIILTNFYYESLDELTMGDEVGLVL